MTAEPQQKPEIQTYQKYRRAVQSKQFLNTPKVSELSK
jgi:hypothetical protein